MSKKRELRRCKAKKMKLYEEGTRYEVSCWFAQLTHYSLEAVEWTGIEWGEWREWLVGHFGKV